MMLTILHLLWDETPTKYVPCQNRKDTLEEALEVQGNEHKTMVSSIFLLKKHHNHFHQKKYSNMYIAIPNIDESISASWTPRK
jgi:hypothetical protein